MKCVDIYTDGSCLGNPGRGGWAYAVVDQFGDISFQDSGGKRNTTNNEMELTAFLNAILYAQSVVSDTEILTIYSDSRYIVDSINKKWVDKWMEYDQRSRPNFELWSEVYSKLRYLKMKIPKVFVVWVKAHEINKFNNFVDELARGEAQKL